MSQLLTQEDGPISEVEFEGYYNRDSTRYVGIYNIPEAKTVIRSTYRYKVRTLYNIKGVHILTDTR